MTLGTGPAPPLPFCLAAAQNFDPNVLFAPVCCVPRVTMAQRPLGTPRALGNTQINQTQKKLETRRCRGGVWGWLCSEPTRGPRSPVGQSALYVPGGDITAQDGVGTDQCHPAVWRQGRRGTQ